MKGLALDQSGEQFLGRHRVMAVPFKLSNTPFLPGNMSLAFGNVPLGLFQVIKDLGPVPT
jgi:hypothetical protein